MKTRPKIFLLTAAMFFFCASGAKAFVYSKDSTLNAEKLITHADRALLFIVKSAQETQEEKLMRSHKESEPFWAAVKKLNSNIDKLIKYSFLKDDAFNKTLAEAMMAKEEMIVTYDLLEVNDTKVKEGIDKASKSIDLLYENYSKEAGRMKKGETLTADEQKQLDEIKSQNEQLLKKLDELESKVADNKQLLKKIKKIKEKSNQVVHTHHNSAGFFFAMNAMHMIHGWMWGCHWWWGPWGGWYPGFYHGYVEIYVDIWDDYAYDWGYLDGTIDAYEYELELDLEMELTEMEALDDYMLDIDVESELYSMDDLSFDGFGGVDESLDLELPMNDLELPMDDLELPMNDLALPMDDLAPLMDFDNMGPAAGLEEIEYMDDFSDMDLGGFEDW